MARADRLGAVITVAVEPFGSPAWREMVTLRHEVLRAPLGLAFRPDELDREAGLRHLALRHAGALVGALLIRPAAAASSGAPARFRQMAVRAAFRGRGLGTALLAAGERLAASEGARHGLLHARLTARPFYERAGWLADGPEFEEVGLAHVRMRKPFRPDNDSSHDNLGL